MIHNEFDLKHLLCSKLLKVKGDCPYTYYMIESHNNVGFPDMIFIDSILGKTYFVEFKFSKRSFEPLEKLENLIRPNQYNVLKKLVSGNNFVFIIKGYSNAILFYELKYDMYKIYRTDFISIISFETVKLNRL